MGRWEDPAWLPGGERGRCCLADRLPIPRSCLDPNTNVSNTIVMPMQFLYRPLIITITLTSSITNSPYHQKVFGNESHTFQSEDGVQNKQIGRVRAEQQQPVQPIIIIIKGHSLRRACSPCAVSGQDRPGPCKVAILHSSDQV